MAPGRPRVQRGVNVNQEEQVPLNNNGLENEEVPNKVPRLMLMQPLHKWLMP